MATIKEVAAHAGVSITTVSHAINHPDRVSGTMRLGVKNAIRDLGYNPNPTAQNLRTGRTNLVALLIPDVRNPFFAHFVQVVQTEVSGHGLDTIIYNADVPGSMAKTYIAEYLSQIGQHRFDGLIVVEEALIGNIDILSELDLATVYIGHLERPIVDNVVFDDFGAAYEITEHLIEIGHRSIGHITGELDFESGKQRYQGFQQALKDHGLSVNEDLVYSDTYFRPAGRDGIRYLLERDEPPTAVFIASSQMAIGAFATIHDMGRQIPDDIAVATIDYDDNMEDMRPTLTTIDYNPRLVGHIAANQLLERLGGDNTEPPRSINIPFTLLKRNSTSSS